MDVSPELGEVASGALLNYIQSCSSARSPEVLQHPNNQDLHYLSALELSGFSTHTGVRYF